MKKFILLALLIFPTFVAAEENVEIEVASATKYYKTVTVLNNSEVMRNANYGEVSSFTTEISKTEYDNFNPDENITPKGTITSTTETTYKRLTTTINYYSPSIYKYKSVLTWKNIPSTRNYDIMGIGYYASVENHSTPMLTNEYCVGNDCYEYQGYYVYTGNNGTGVMFHLPSGSITSLEQTLEVFVKKYNSSSTIIEQIAVGDYSHATTTVSYNNAKKFLVDTGGISLDSVIYNSYDALTETRASWTGRW